MGYFVYCHTNKINNKRYVGITKQKPEKRYKNGLGYKHNEYFYNAILKHGWEEFSHEILFSGLSLSDAEEKERELISKWNLTDRQYGYNIESGGNLKKEVAQETKNKLSKITKRQMTLEARKHLSDCARNQFATKGHPCSGKKLTEATKNKISNSHSFHSKGINQYTLDGIFIKHYNSLHEMERETGFFRSAVINFLKGNSNYCYGYIWKRGGDEN